MMGAMIEDILPPDNYTAMLIYMNVLFIVSGLFIVTMMNVELKKYKENVTFKPRTYPRIITTVISTILIFAFSYMEADTIESHQDQSDAHEHHH
ncbi:hypothetical protein [Domibacillus mangrovi]|uniref:Uncharacterized protein n=1 Tax=Domibacillus mangrovi TaxID=1714354 RepID=A0A1Q5NZV8_9BACI|nr:hypothetical protein [Domibacillus mangrovi]OKL35392.1 hypothetical protein BLL40_15680 [Domibacillus mangrovi]